MNSQWISKNQSKKLIVFFNGWGMDENPIRHLDPKGYDVLMVYDYSELNHPFTPDLMSSYEEFTLIGWSMGVWACAYFRSLFPKHHCVTIAINGTPYPIHDHYGIPHVLYDMTLDHLNEEGVLKFFKRMFHQKEDISRFLTIKSQRALENQKQELEKLKLHTHSHEFKHPPVFCRVLISDTDKIIPSKNQIEYWKEHPRKKILKSGHYPFFRWNSYQELIDEATSD